MLIIPCLTQANPTDFAHKLANQYLKSFPTEAPIKQGLDAFSLKRKPYKSTIYQSIALSKQHACATVLTKIFSESAIYQAQYIDNIVHEGTWNDLHLFYGTINNLSHNFISRINHTTTILGECALCSLISTPIYNITELKKRQAILNYLRNNTAISNSLHKILYTYKNKENNILSLWTKTDPLYSQNYESYLTNLFYTKNYTKNKAAKALQIKKLLTKDFLNIYAKFIAYPLASAIIGELLIIPGFSITHKFFYKEVFPFFLPIKNIFHAYHTTQHLGTTLQALCLTIPLVITAHSFEQGYQAIANYKAYHVMLKNLALRMADIQAFIMILQEIDQLIQNNPTFSSLYKDKLKAIHKLLNHSIDHAEIDHLLYYCKTLPFGSWSYMWHNAGKLLASYKLFTEHKAIFHDAMYELGQLDAFLSMATLMDQTTNTNQQYGYTFAKFLDPQTYLRPHLTITELWNPMLKTGKCIKNNLAMGGNTHTQHIILTGPNAGGKSTFLTGITYAILLSQTFGIAPVKSIEITPFRKIHTYIELTDDIAAGQSLFMAEVCRLKEHLNSLQTLKKTEFSFTIFDEPFRGTNPIEGAATAYACLNYIAEHKNHLNIVATHYPLVMMLEHKEPLKHFKNYKVYIKKHKGGSIYYTYKIIPGISTQTIALDILEEQGYAKKILQIARDVIDNPPKYQQYIKNINTNPNNQ